MSECFLVGLDNSECSGRALAFAAQRANYVGARLELIYVIEWSPYSFNTAEENAQRHKRREEEITAATAGVVEPAVKAMKEKGLEVTGIVRHGNVAEVLSSVASENDATQIVVGRIGESGMRALVFGSVTSKLIQLAKVPVTVVP